MIEAKRIIDNLTNIIQNAVDGSTIDIADLIECVEALKDISEEKDIHRNEVIATGYVYEVSYIHHEDKPNGLVKFLLEKMRRDSHGKAIRGRIACVMEDSKLNTDLRNGDRVKIWADFSPYETHRDDGITFHKIKLWVDKLERIDKGTKNYISRKEIVAG